MTPDSPGCGGIFVTQGVNLSEKISEPGAGGARPPMAEATGDELKEPLRVALDRRLIIKFARYQDYVGRRACSPTANWTTRSTSDHNGCVGSRGGPARTFVPFFFFAAAGGLRPGSPGTRGRERCRAACA